MSRKTAVEKVVERMIVVVAIGAVGLLGLIVWAIIKLVNHFAS